MASTIKIKNSSTAGAAPTASDLVQGELAVNVTDKRIYTENSGGTIVELGTNPSVPVTFPDGSASAPSLTNDGDTNTGVFFPAADTFGVTTGGTERARIDSSGNLLAGTTSTIAPSGVTADHALVGTTGNGRWAVGVKNSGNSTPWGLAVEYGAAAPNNTSQNFLWCVDTAAQRFSVRSNGGIANYSANDANLSDRREKTNFAPAKSYLDVICAIPVQTYNYIDQNMEEDDGLTLGVVAQDVQAVAPELVTESNWGTEEEPKMRLSIYQTDLQYALMKCIQEQQAMITTLTARIEALEAA